VYARRRGADKDVPGGVVVSGPDDIATPITSSGEPATAAPLAIASPDVVVWTDVVELPSAEVFVTVPSGETVVVAPAASGIPSAGTGDAPPTPARSSLFRRIS
jgi:hypothetical protein